MSQHADFIDHHGREWGDVRRVRCRFYNRFHYEYPGPIYDLKQRLVVIPADQYGTQQLRSCTSFSSNLLPSPPLKPPIRSATVFLNSKSLPPNTACLSKSCSKSKNHAQAEQHPRVLSSDSEDDCVPPR